MKKMYGKNIESFEEKKASEYVENHGYDIAIEKLSNLAVKSSQAKKIMNIILSKHAPKKETYCEKKDVFVSNPCDAVVSHSVRHEKPTPKQMYTNLIERLGVGFDTRADENWRPVLPVTWKNGKAFVNGKKVVFPKNNIGFMRRYVLNNNSNVVFDMHVLKAFKNKIVAEPDVDDYFRRKRREDRERREQQMRAEQEKMFEGSVYLGEERLIIRTKKFRKHVVIPNRFLSALVDVTPKGKYLGCWTFRILDDKPNKVVAKPIEMLEKPTDKRPTRQLSKENNQTVSNKPRDTNNFSFVTSFVSDNRLEKLYNDGSIKL